MPALGIPASRPGGIGLPVTGFALSTEFTSDLINMVGGSPLVHKGDALFHIAGFDDSVAVSESLDDFKEEFR